MTPAELRIIISVRAAEARKQLELVQQQISRLNAAATSSSASVRALAGTIASLATPMKMTSAAAADLAKNLSIIGNGKVSKEMAAISAASDKAAVSMNAARVGAEYLTVAIANLGRASQATAAHLGAVAAAAGAMGKAANASAAANAAAAAGAAATGAAAGKGALQVKQFSKEWRDYNSATNTAFQGQRQLTAGIGATTGATAANSAATAANAAALGSTAAASRSFGQRLDDGRSKLFNMSTALTANSDAIRKQGSQMQWAGRQISLAFTAPMALAVGMGTKWQLDLEKQQTQLLKVYGDVNTPLEENRAAVQELQKQFRVLSDTMGVSQEEVTGIGAAWAQAGKSGQALATYTKLTAEAMIIGDMSAQQAQEGMQAVALQWGITAKDMKGSMAVMNMASNITQVSFQDLFDGMSRVGGNARILGFTFRETTALLTVLTRVTGSAATAGNGLKSIMTRLLAPTDEAVDVLGKLGLQVSSQEWRSKAPVERLKEISQQVKGLSADDMAEFNKKFSGLFQIARGAQIFTDLANPMGNFNKVMQNTADGTGDASKSMRQYEQELKLFLESNPQKFKIAGTAIKNSIMDIAVILLPTILKIVQTIAKLAEGFSNLSPEVQKVIIGVGLFLAAVGPLAIVLGSTKVLFGLLGGSLGWLGKMFGKSGDDAKKATGLFGFFIKGVKSIVGPVFKTATGVVKAWASGMAGMTGATAAGGAATNATQARNSAMFYNTVRMGAGEAAAAQRAGMTVIEGTIISSGPRQAAATRANMAAQAGAIRSSTPALAAAQRTASAGAAGAAATGGVAAGAAAGEGTKRGFKGKLGGITTLLASVFFFLPKSWREGAGKAIKGAWTGIKDGVKNFKLGEIFKRLGINSAKDLGKGLVRGLSGKAGWIGALVGAVVGGLFYAWDDIKKAAGEIFGKDTNVPMLARPFVLAAKAIYLALSKLPEIVVDVFKAVVNTIAAAGRAVYKAFSYINPFAHHSPSLVENVTKGMAVVTGQFADGSKSIQNSMRSAYGGINKFGKMASGLTMRADSIDTDKRNADLNRADPSGAAKAAYDGLSKSVQNLTAHSEELTRAQVRQQSVIDGLEKRLKAADEAIEGMNKTLDALQKISDSVGKALSSAQDQLDKFSNAPIKGMRAMNDAIFENEMASKRLELQIMDLENAGDSIDSVKDKFADLQGQIESLSGERENLRLAGAGSDILGTYDKMIADLKAQQGKAVSGPSSEIEQLNKQLDELKKKGERLDLVNSLQFDTLTHQIENLKNTTQELSFDEIVSGITTYQGAVSSLTVMDNAAKAAVEGQQAAIDAATVSRDALSKTIDTEKEKLDQVNDAYSANSTAISDVQSQMDNITQAASTVNGKLDEMEQAAKEAADKLKEASDAGDDAFGSGGFEVPPIDTTNVDEGINEISEKIRNGIGDFKFPNPFGKLGDMAKTAGSAIGKGLLWAITNLPVELTKGINYLAGFIVGLLIKGIVGALVGLYKIGQNIVDGVDQAFGAVVEWIRSGGIGRAFSGFWGYIEELFTDPTAWAQRGDDLLNGLKNGIASAFGGALNWVYDLMIKPLVDGFKDGLGIHSPSTVFFGFAGDILQGLLDGLVGGVGAVLTWFTELPGKIGEAIGDLGSWIGGKISAAWTWLNTQWDIYWGVASLWWSNLPGKIVDTIGDIGGWIGGKFRSAWEWINTQWDIYWGVAKQWWSNLPDSIKNALGALKDRVVEPFQNAFDSVTRKLGEWKDNVLGVFENLPGLIGKGLDKIGGAVKIPINFVIDKVYNSGIRSIWNNTASKIPGIGDMPYIQPFAKGGRVEGPGTGTSDSILTTARPGSEIFTAREVSNAGGFRGLEALLAGMGIGAGNHNRGKQVPVALSNGEYKLSPEQVASLGGSRKVKELRAALAAGQMPGHDIGDVVADVGGAISGAAKKTVGAGRSAAAAIVEKALDQLDKLIPDLLNPPGGEVGRIPQATFNAVRNPIVGAIRGHANGGTVRGYADGGTTTTAPPVVPGDTGASAISSGSTLVADVTAATTEAAAVWAAYNVSIETGMTTHYASLQAISTAANVAIVTDNTNTIAALTAANTAFRAAEVAADSAYRATLLANSQAANAALLTATQAFRASMGVEFTGIRDDSTSRFTELSENLNNIVTGPITDTLNTFEPLLKSVEGWFATSVDNIGTTFDKVKEKTSTPAKFVINDVYNDGIRGAWNQFNKYLDLPELPEFKAKFATGGSVFGRGTATSDSIPAMLSNGEHVITAREVKAAGGHNAVERQRQAWLSGQVPAFARGGPVDLKAAPWPGGGGESNLKPAAILARRNVHKYFPEIQTIGGYRASDPYPDHPSGLALDIMVGTAGNPIGDEINSWLHANMAPLALNYTIWKQFYKPAGGAGNLMEDRGSITQNHYDHIHALFNANGVPGIQDGGVGGGTAAVFDYRKMIADGIKSSMDEIRKRDPKLGGGIGKWPMKSVDVAQKKLEDFLLPKADALGTASGPSGGSGNIAFNAGAGTEQWRKLATEMLIMQGQSPNYTQRLLMQMNTESGGNPNAINLWDSNAAAGIPSKGLMQVIDPTFQTYRDPRLPNNIWDPAANIAASIRYSMARYGSLDAAWNGVGYDSGGWLEPGVAQTVNATGKPEAILTNADWNAIYAAANNPITDQMITDGVTNSLQDAIGFDVSSGLSDIISDSTSAAYAKANEAWVPLILGNNTEVADAAKTTADAAKKTQTGVEKFTEVGTGISKQVNNLSAVMLALSTAIQSGADGKLTFGQIAPLLEAAGTFISGLPDAEPTYVDWAGTDQIVTEQMRQQKTMNDIANAGKGLYQGFKDVAPVVLKHTATIGTAIEQLIQQDSAAWTSAIGLLSTGNPMGALILVPVILKEIFTILPLVINAIMDIVPALIKAILNFFNKFMPDSVYAYDDYASANDAVVKNKDAIRSGASAPYFRPPTKSTTTTQTTSNENVTIYVYGGVNMPNVTNESGAKNLTDNLKTIAANS